MPEGPEIDYPEVDANVDFPTSEDVDFDDSSSNHSGITAHTQAELSDLDRESMIDLLPFLHQYSEFLIRFFSSEDPEQLRRLYHDLQHPASKAAKRLDNLNKGYSINREQYGDEQDSEEQDDKYHPIDVSRIGPFMCGIPRVDDITHSPYQLNTLLYFANIAGCISKMFSFQSGEQIRDVLHTLLNTFPTPFGPIGDFDDSTMQPHSSSDLVHETLSLVLEIRTQYLLCELIDRQDDPDEILRSIFYIEDSDRLRGVDYTDMTDDLPKDTEILFMRRIKRIRQHFSTDINQSVDIDALLSQFSYTDFLVFFAQWTRMMTKEHRSMLAAQGGVEEIQKQLQAAHDIREPNKENDISALTSGTHEMEGASSAQRKEQRPTRVSKASEGNDAELQISRRKGKNRKSVTSFQKAKQNIKARQAATRESATTKSASTPAVTEPAHNVYRVLNQATTVPIPMRVALAGRSKVDDATEGAMASASTALPAHAYVEHIQADEGDEDDEPIEESLNRQQRSHGLSQNSQIVVATMAKHEIQGSKENIKPLVPGKPRLIDKQSNAEKVMWESDEERDARGKTNPRGNSAKRKLTNVEGEDEDGEGYFEVDERPTQSSHRPNDLRPVQQARGSLSGQRVTMSPPKRRRLANESIGLPDEDDAANANGGEDEVSDSANEASRAESGRHPQRSTSAATPVRRVPLRRRDAPPSSSAPPRENSEPTVGAEIIQLSQRNKEETKPKISKERSRWSEEEIGRLIDLIEEHGVSWKLLKQKDDGHKDGALLNDRDQVSLKDKARNIKMDILKYVARLQALLPTHDLQVID